jgi:hypothetical protein
MNITRLFRAASISMAAVAGSLSLFGGSASAAAPWTYQYWTGAGTVIVQDANYNGRIDNVWMDLDHDGRWDTHMFDNDGYDQVLEWVSLDANENGRPEMYVYSTNGTSGWFYINTYYDDGRTYASYPFPTTSTSTIGSVGGVNTSLVNTVITMRTASTPNLSCGFQYAGTSYSCNF